jgi:hypothetical protein
MSFFNLQHAHQKTHNELLKDFENNDEQDFKHHKEQSKGHEEKSHHLLVPNKACNARLSN